MSKSSGGGEGVCNDALKSNSPSISSSKSSGGGEGVCNDALKSNSPSISSSKSSGGGEGVCNIVCGTSFVSVLMSSLVIFLSLWQSGVVPSTSSSLSSRLL